MLVGISGKKQNGKNTIALIWQYLYDKYSNYKYYDDNEDEEEDFKNYIKDKYYLKSKFYLKEYYEQKSFAYKLKQIVCILINCTMEQLEDDKFKNTYLGSEWTKYELSYYNNELETFVYKYFTNYEDSFKHYNMYSDITENEVIKKIKLTPRILLQLLGTECGKEIIHPNIWINSLFSEYYLDCNWLITDVRFEDEANFIKNKNGILIRVNKDSIVLDEHKSETSLDNYNYFDYKIDNNGSIDDLINEVKKIMINLKVI